MLRGHSDFFQCNNVLVDSRFAGGDRHPLTSSLASEVGSIIRCEGTADCLLGFLKQLIQGFKALTLEHRAQLRV